MGFIFIYIEKQRKLTMSDKKPAAKKAPAAHPTFKVMVASAIVALKNKKGSSRQAVQKYIEGNFKGLNSVNVHLKKALKGMLEKGDLILVKGTGAAGTYKLKEKPKVAKKKPAAKKPAAKKPAAKKAPAKKKPAAKKSPAKAK